MKMSSLFHFIEVPYANRKLFPKMVNYGHLTEEPFRYKVELGDGAMYEGTIGKETLTYRTGYMGFSTIDDVYLSPLLVSSPTPK